MAVEPVELRLIENETLSTAELSAAQAVWLRLNEHLRRSAIQTARFVHQIDDFTADRLNARYRTPIHLAQLFLRYLSLEGHSGHTPFSAYLPPMADVFERFPARYLVEQFAAHPRISVRAQESLWLDEAFRESGRLDILLRWAGRPALILDTKYKTFDGAPSEADRNQMFMYCHALRVSRAMLVYADNRPIAYEARFPGMWLAARSLALDGSLADFRQRCRALAQALVDDLRGL